MMKIFSTDNNYVNNPRELIDSIATLVDYAEDEKIDLDTVGDARKLIIDIQERSLFEMPSEECINDDFAYQERKKVVERLVDIQIALIKSISASSDGNVTISTLRATRSVDGKKTFNTATGRYLISLWVIMFTLVATAIYFQFQFEAYGMVTPLGDNEESTATTEIMLIDAVNPFLFGTLGACVYLMRVTSVNLRNRTFAPSSLPEHLNRLLLGTVSGGMIIMLLEDTLSIGTPGDGVPITAAGIGFIAGYSIEFLYQIIDRIIAAILPVVSSAYDPNALEKKKKALLHDRYEKELTRAQNNNEPDETVNLLKQILDDLK
jgi:hypothetical protein